METGLWASSLLLISICVTGVMQKQQLDRIERKQRLILEKLGIETEKPSEAVRSLLQQGRNIDALKQYRKETGLDLRSAKENLEALSK